MEPKQSAPNLSPERTPAVPYETGPGQAIEVGQSSDQRIERREATGSAEQTPGVVQNGPVLPAPLVIPSVPAPAADGSSPGTAPADDLPLVAGDDDLIEKEWVDKAKKIIAETKDDPYRREMEISRLQIDYLKKRYGKQLGEAT